MTKAAMLPLVAASIVAHPLANDDFLEPSVLNEVEHALSAAPTNSPPSYGWTPSTNALSRTALALLLVTSQRADGRWFAGTNDVTSSARRILERLAAESRDRSPP